MLTSTTDSMNAEIAYRQERIGTEFRRANGRRTGRETGTPKHSSGRRRLLWLRPAA
jgi:hypothetical protein